MTGLKLVRSLAVAAAALIVTGAFAAGSVDLNITAQVKGTCRLDSVTAMTFLLDPSLGGDQTQPSTVTYRCTKDTAAPKFSVGSATGGTYNSGANPLVGTGSNAVTIPFAVTWTDPTAKGLGLGSGGDQTITLTGKISEAAYLDAPADTYSKLVPVTFAP